MRDLVIVPVLVLCLALAPSLVGAALAPSVARAQPETAQAREMFEQGVQASREERWADAVDLFQQSYEMSPRPITMINLAGALAQLGRLVEAAEAYRSFLSMARSGSAARLRSDAETQLRALEGRIPRVRIRVLGIQESDVVRLDEWEVSHAALDLPVPVDPGTHEITIEREGVSRSFPFSAAESVASEVVFDARPDAFASARGPGETVPDLAVTPGDPVTTPPPSRSIVEEPVFWIVIGAVVLGGAAVGLGVGLGTQQQGGLYVGNVAPAGVPL